MKIAVLKYSMVFLFFLGGIREVSAQFATNTHNGVSSNTVIFDMSQVDEKIVKGDSAKGFVLPVVTIDDLLDTKSPIEDPADGLLVYNNSKVRIPGVYIFKNGMWSAIVNRGSSIENAVAPIKEVENIFEINKYYSLKLDDVIFDNTYGDVKVENELLHLLPGNYLITVYLSGKLTSKNLKNALGQSSQSVRAHLINFRSKIEIDGREGLNTSFVDVLVPMTGKSPNKDDFSIETSKSFSATLYFVAVISENDKGIVNVLLSTQNGTTYENDTIKILDSYVNIEKSILK